MDNLGAASMEALGTVEAPPRSIRVERDLRIPLADGRRLSARLWLPEDALTQPVPALVEYCPFRHRDFTFQRDALIHPWFAGQGYASLRLDPAGSQDSDGTPMDEYVAQEQDDAVEALAWIAGQPWCSGATGIFGMSWGAFSALQVAARRPPSLKAVIPVHGTDDRYRDDIHFKGGALLSAGLAWGALYQTYCLRPPDPTTCGTDWRELWQARMASAPNILANWLAHPTRDTYWRHASIAEDYASIEAATLIFCGWADGYSNAALRMAQYLQCPRRLVIGPWSHSYPHLARPGPRIGFLQEAKRWWDRWLKGIDNGAQDEAAIQVYVQDTVPPRPSYDHRKGTWIATASWPPPEVRTERLYLTPSGLLAGTARSGQMRIKSPLGNAMAGGEWLPHGVGPEMPPDQRREDAGALTFDTAVLAEDWVLCGAPRASLKLSADRPSGQLVLRLSDLAPDGTATLITYGLLELGRRNGLDRAEPLSPDQWLDVDLDLDALAQRLPAGHRLRLAVSTRAWPMIWPAADTTTLTLDLAQCHLDLPLRPSDAPAGPVSDFAPVAVPPPAATTQLRPVTRERVVTADIGTGEMVRRDLKDDGQTRIEEDGLTFDSWGELRYRHLGEDPLSARADYRYRLGFQRDAWSVRLETEVTVTATCSHFLVEGESRAYDSDSEVFRRRHDTKARRP